MPNLGAILRAMRGRYSSNHIDKVWAIAIPFQRRKARSTIFVTLPIYNASTPVEVAWRLLISTMASIKMDATRPTSDPSASLWVFGTEILRRLLVYGLWQRRWEILWRQLGKKLSKMIMKQLLKQLIPSVASAKVDATAFLHAPGTLVSVFWQLWEQLWKRRPWNQPRKRLWKLLWKQLWKLFWKRLIPIPDNTMSLSASRRTPWQGTIYSGGLAKDVLAPLAWDQLWKQLRKQVWGQFWNLPVYGPGVPHSLASIWKQLWKRLWKQLWKRYWKPLVSLDVGAQHEPSMLELREGIWEFTRILVPQANDPTSACSLTIQQNPTIQLLCLFPHPSKHHWFPSWTQVQQYPDVSVRDDDQGNDETGDMDYSLRIMSGRIYRGCSLQLTQSPTPEKKAIYCCGKDVQLEATVPGIDLNIDSQSNYVLVDISPDPGLWPGCLSDEEIKHLTWYNMIDCCKKTDIGHDHPPIWQKSVILVCEEVDTIPQSKADNALVSEGPLAIMRHRLRRVTTLEWNCRPSAMPADPTSMSPGHWLPFKPSLVNMRSIVCSATGGKYSVNPLVDDPDVFCDPKAVTGLWSQEGWQEEWNKQWPVYEVYLV